MVKILSKNNKSLYQCEACGFFYEDRAMAEKCQEWCREHKSRNLEIIKHAVPEREENALEASKT